MTAYTNEVLNERESTHGDYSDTARISQELKDVIREGKGYRMLDRMQRESVDLICTKLGRLLSGDPNHKDSWLDISGYADLISERLK